MKDGIVFPSVNQAMRHLVEDGIEADPNAEYFITYDMPKIWDNPELPRGSIVTNVRSTPRQGGYEFAIKETGVVSHTMYPWALALNTPHNLARLDSILVAERARDAANRAVKKEWAKLQTLKK